MPMQKLVPRPLPPRALMFLAPTSSWHHESASAHTCHLRMRRRIAVTQLHAIYAARSLSRITPLAKSCAACAQTYAAPHLSGRCGWVPNCAHVHVHAQPPTACAQALPHSSTGEQGMVAALLPKQHVWHGAVRGTPKPMNARLTPSSCLPQAILQIT